MRYIYIMAIIYAVAGIVTAYVAGLFLAIAFNEPSNNYTGIGAGLSLVITAYRANPVRDLPPLRIAWLDNYVERYEQLNRWGYSLHIKRGYKGLELNSTYAKRLQVVQDGFDAWKREQRVEK